MKVTGDWITHPGTQALFDALEGVGHRAFFVGGCVRNAMLQTPISDVDIATEAVPESVTSCAEAAGFRVIPTGVDHGTVTVLAHGAVHEVTTFRRDVATDGRHALVAFSNRLDEDAARRDFTMNALYADRTGAILDPIGGMADLLSRRVRFVGDPATRIREDYLRVLRFFRFHAQYGDPDQGIDADGLAACAEASESLGSLSRERIGSEMRKLLSAADPAPAVASMAAAGVLAAILPGAQCRDLAPLVHLEGSEAPRWIRRLAVLGGLDLSDRLRLSRHESRDLGKIRDEIANVRTPAALGFLLGRNLAADVVLARAAVLEHALPEGWAAEVDRGARTEFPVTSGDLADTLEGAALGARLRDLKAQWLQSDLTLTRAQLLA